MEHQALECLMTLLLNKVRASGVFPKKGPPDKGQLQGIADEMPCLLSFHAFPPTPCLILTNESTRQFYGLETCDASHLNLSFYTSVMHASNFKAYGQLNHFFLSGGKGYLRQFYRQRNGDGVYEPLLGLAAVVNRNKIGLPRYIVAVACREHEVPLLNAIVNLELFSLTERHRNCLQHLLAGKSNQEIATALERSTKSIEIYVREILSQTSCKSRGELIAASFTVPS